LADHDLDMTSTPGISTREVFGLDRQLWRLSSVVVLGALMSILDTTIVNVAIDALSRDFRSPLATIQWVSTGYLLALSMVIPLTGWAVERFGAKRMWMLSLILFLAGSALSGAAWSAQSLIVFRILQGIGGGMIMPIGQTILAQAAGPRRMGRVMSIIGVPMLLGPVLGPIIGGLIVDTVTWRWIFYVNVPIGVVALILAFRILPSSRGGVAKPLDIVGVALLSPGLALLVYGLAEAGNQGSTVQVALPLALASILLVSFVFHALRTRLTPLIEVRLFRDRSFSAAAATTFLFGAALFGAMLLLPLYYQVVRGESALTAGLLMAPQGIGAAIAMPLAGRLTDRLGAGRVVPCGLILAMVGTLAYTQLGSNTSYTLLAGSLFVRGIGFGFTMMPSIAAAYQTLKKIEVPRATTAVNIIQRVGGSVGTALLAVVLQRRIVANLPGSSGSVATTTSIPPAVRVHLAQPLAHAFGQAFWWAFFITAIGLIPALLLPMHPPEPDEDGSEEPERVSDVTAITPTR
jgi:EmrB/QacA subfamily drug resistance transporter